MTLEDRVKAVTTFGFTPRQAAFLTTVMLHSGVFVARQYTAFARIAFGQTTRDFLGHLVNARLATPHESWTGGGRVFHVHYKPLYRAIGEPDNRNRRPVTMARAVERLMLLDVVLSAPKLTWLATEKEKLLHFAKTLGTLEGLPTLTFERGGSQTVRHFPDKRPIGLETNDRSVFAFAATDPTGMAFRRFLGDHRRLFQRLRNWTIHVAIPQRFGDCEATHRRVWAEFVGTPVRPSVAEEFRWYCHARRAIEDRRTRLSPTDSAKLAAARRAFGAPRFFAAYRTWRDVGDAAINELLSPRLHDAWTRGDARLDVRILPFQYHHLAHAAATA